MTWDSKNSIAIFAPFWNPFFFQTPLWLLHSRHCWSGNTSVPACFASASHFVWIVGRVARRKVRTIIQKRKIFWSGFQERESLRDHRGFFPLFPAKKIVSIHVRLSAIPRYLISRLFACFEFMTMIPWYSESVGGKNWDIVSVKIDSNFKVTVIQEYLKTIEKKEFERKKPPEKKDLLVRCNEQVCSLWSRFSDHISEEANILIFLCSGFAVQVWFQVNHRHKCNNSTMQACTRWEMNGTCVHYVMVSKFQWKPFWLATQRDPQNDWTATQNRVNYDVFAQAPFI